MKNILIFVMFLGSVQINAMDIVAKMQEVEAAEKNEQFTWRQYDALRGYCDWERGTIHRRLAFPGQREAAENEWLQAAYALKQSKIELANMLKFCIDNDLQSCLTKVNQYADPETLARLLFIPEILNDVDQYKKKSDV